VCVCSEYPPLALKPNPTLQVDGIAKGRHGKKPAPVHHTDGLRFDLGAVGGGLGLFELGASSGAVDGPKGGGSVDATGAVHEGALNLAHQAKIREAREYLRQQNAQKQQQRFGLPHPLQPQYQPQPPPPPPAPAPPQGVSSPKKRGFAEMAKGDSVTALPVLDAPGAKGVARVKQSQCVGRCRARTFTCTHARAHCSSDGAQRSSSRPKSSWRWRPSARDQRCGSSEDGN
jgi:hypothetical protein